MFAISTGGERPRQVFCGVDETILVWRYYMKHAHWDRKPSKSLMRVITMPKPVGTVKRVHTFRPRVDLETLVRSEIKIEAK